MQMKRTKHIVDMLLGIGLLLLMSYQVTGEAGHEWTGMSMTLLMILHQILNRKWYAALFKGRYTPLRIVQTQVNAALVICFVLTALCGINMSVHAVPFLSEFMRASLGRRLHLTLSHWCFVLMGLHLGLHIPAMLSGIKSRNGRRIGFGCSMLAAGAGLWLLLRNSYPDYLLYRVPFAFIDYDKAVPIVLLEALLIAFFWVFIGAQMPKLLNRRGDQNRKLTALIGILLAVVIGMGLTFAFPSGNGGSGDEEAAPWAAVKPAGRCAKLAGIAGHLHPLKIDSVVHIESVFKPVHIGLSCFNQRRKNVIPVVAYHRDPVIYAHAHMCQTAFQLRQAFQRSFSCSTGTCNQNAALISDVHKHSALFLRL